MSANLTRVYTLPRPLSALPYPLSVPSPIVVFGWALKAALSVAMSVLGVFQRVRWDYVVEEIIFGFFSSVGVVVFCAIVLFGTLYFLFPDRYHCWVYGNRKVNLLSSLMDEWTLKLSMAHEAVLHRLAMRPEERRAAQIYMDRIIVDHDRIRERICEYTASTFIGKLQISYDSAWRKTIDTEILISNFHLLQLNSWLADLDRQPMSLKGMLPKSMRYHNTNSKMKGW